MKKIIYLTIISLIFAACDLERDNRLDEKFNGGGGSTSSGAKIEFASYSIYSDNNGDKIINKGEKIQLRVSLKNTGSSRANDVKAVFSTTSTDVSGFAMYQNASEISYGDISASSTTGSGTYYYDVQFTVSNTAVAGTQIPININITDENNNTWTANFSVTVQATGATIEFASYSIYSDNNGDKIINKGEKIQLRVSLKNTGSSEANAVKAVFSTTSQDVSGFAMYQNASEISYGDISAGSTTGSGTYYYDVQFTVSNTAVAGTQIPININITDENNNTWTANFSVTVQATGATIEFASYSIYSDNNGDKIINKGEKIQLRVSLKNTGSSEANAVKAVFSTTSQDVSGFAMYQNASEISYGDISASLTTGSGTYYYDVQFTVSNAAVAGTQIPINISITDESNNAWSSSFKVTVQ